MEHLSGISVKSNCNPNRLDDPISINRPNRVLVMATNRLPGLFVFDNCIEILMMGCLDRVKLTTNNVAKGGTVRSADNLSPRSFNNVQPRRWRSSRPLGKRICPWLGCDTTIGLQNDSVRRNRALSWRQFLLFTSYSLQYYDVKGLLFSRAGRRDKN